MSIVTCNSDLPRLIKPLEHLVESVEFAEEQGMISRAELTLVDNSLKGSSSRGDLSGDSPSRSITAGPLLLPPLERLNHNIIFNDKNIGQGQANHQVIMMTDCEYQLVPNLGACTAKDYLSVGLRYLAAHPETAMVVPAGEDNHGNPAFLCKRYLSVMTLVRRKGPRHLLMFVRSAWIFFSRHGWKWF